MTKIKLFLINIKCMYVYMKNIFSKSLCTFAMTVHFRFELIFFFFWGKCLLTFVCCKLRKIMKREIFV